MKKRKKGKPKTPLPPEKLVELNRLRQESAEIWEKLRKKADPPKGR